MKGRDPGASWLPGAWMPVRWDVARAKYARVLRAQGPTRAVLGQLAFRAALWAAGQASWALDEVAHRGWRAAQVRGPIFIVGHQRSGTTFLHRLMARDPRLRALRLHEMLLPAVSAQRALDCVARIDAATGGHLARRIRSVEARLFEPLDDLHRVRFDAVEEDEMALWPLFASLMVVNDAPSTCGDPAFDAFRDLDGWAPRDRWRALGWYRACLLKRAHDAADAGERWALAKNPAFSKQIPALVEVFPDARFVWLHRDPAKAVASRLSLVQAIWRRGYPGFGALSPAHVEAVVADSVRIYAGPARDLPRLPPSRWLRVEFDALTSDPAAAVTAIYDHFGLGTPHDTVLASLASRRGHEPSRHAYALADFGLDAGALRARIAAASDDGLHLTRTIR